MKQKTLMVVVLALVVGGIVGFLLNSNISGMKQGAAVSLSKDSYEPRTEQGLLAISKMVNDMDNVFESSPLIEAAFRVNQDQIKSEVDLSKVTKDTKPFSMQVINPYSDGTTIGPSFQEINCGQIDGGVVACCNTGNNNMTLYTNGQAYQLTGLCVNGEWDLI
jgi:hypothetical protein